MIEHVLYFNSTNPDFNNAVLQRYLGNNVGLIPDCHNKAATQYVESL